LHSKHEFKPQTTKKKKKKKRAEGIFGVTVLAGIIHPDYQEETELLFYNGGKEIIFENQIL
jgi:hypothetical protein